MAYRARSPETADAINPEVLRDEPPHSALNNSPQHIAAQGFAQLFGLHPAVAFLIIIIDAMLFGSDVISGGLAMLLSVPVGLVLGVITAMAQRRWYNDDAQTALIKGMIAGLLTAIPTSLPGFLTIPSGVVGVIHTLRGKAN